MASLSVYQQGWEEPARDEGGAAGLRLLAEGEGLRELVLFPRTPFEESDNDDFFDVAQQLQQAEIRERLKTFVESNRGPRSRRTSLSSRGHKETVSSLRQASQKRDTRFPSLSAVSEASSECPIPESHQHFHSVVGHDFRSEVLSSSGAPASGEDELSAYREGSFEDVAAGEPNQLLDSSRALTVSSDFYATKDELASVLACLRRLERKVDWLMSQERRTRSPYHADLSCRVSMTGCFYKGFWLPFKATIRSIWPCRLFLPALDLVESIVQCLLN